MIELFNKIEGLDGHNIYVVSWKPEEDINIKGVIHIIHGMAEHCLRYKTFAKYLIQNGYCVYSHDIRGHGQSIGEGENKGSFDSRNGWDRVVEEVHIVHEFIKKNEQDKTVAILGHSMGSLIARSYIQKYGVEVAAAIFSGTSNSKGVLGIVGIGVSKLISLLKGRTHPSKLLNNMSFGSFNKSFKPNRTEYDWLSRDEEQVNLYIEDELCGFLCATDLYIDLLTGLNDISKKANIQNIPKSLPILFVSGGKDPVGDMGKGVKRVVRMYKSLGYQADIRLFKEARHEILNENNKEEIYKYIVDWLDSNWS